MVTRTGREPPAGPLEEAVLGLDEPPSGLPAWPAALGLALNTASIVSRRTWAECWRAEVSLGQSSISSWLSTPLRPTTVGTDTQTSRMPYAPSTSEETGRIR